MLWRTKEVMFMTGAAGEPTWKPRGCSRPIQTGDSRFCSGPAGYARQRSLGRLRNSQLLGSLGFRCGLLHGPTRQYLCAEPDLLKGDVVLIKSLADERAAVFL